jgi:hypothetical protein
MPKVKTIVVGLSVVDNIWECEVTRHITKIVTWKSSTYWYVQNVSTFPNTFTIVSPLICVFWIQLTRTNTVFSRIALVSCFCAKIRLSGKIPETIAKILFHQKTHGARRRDEEGQGAGLTTRGRGPGLAVPTYGEATSFIASTPPSTYIYPLTWKERGFGVFSR